jgi:hypothetical protein
LPQVKKLTGASKEPDAPEDPETTDPEKPEASEPAEDETSAETEGDKKSVTKKPEDKKKILSKENIGHAKQGAALVKKVIDLQKRMAGQFLAP